MDTTLVPKLTLRSIEIVDEEQNLTALTFNILTDVITGEAIIKLMSLLNCDDYMIDFTHHKLVMYTHNAIEEE